MFGKARLHCGECSEIVRYKEFIFLDEFNTIIHQKCYKPKYIIKDKGTFNEIINKYDFFNDLRH